MEPKVSIIMGSTSDMKVMDQAAKFLEEMEIPFEINALSAHRVPDMVHEFAHNAHKRGIRVIIAGAGGAAHLPGVIAASTPLPVIGVPIKSSNSIDGWDSILSILQMPSGIPVATMALDGAKNAAILAVQILSVADPELFAKFEKELKEGTKTFEKVYLEYNNIKEEDHKHEEAEEGETLPKDQHASVLGKDEESYYYSKHFETASKMALGEVKIITLEEDAGLVLLVKKDISADPYYLETFDLMLRDELEGENHTKAMEDYGKSLDCEINDFSIEQFEIEEIAYPEATTTTY